MAKDTAKKALKATTERLALYNYITVGINVLYVLVALWQNSFGMPSFTTIFAATFWYGQEFIMMYLLKWRATPSFGPGGEVVDCPDITQVEQLGVFSYAQDCLWISWICHVGTMVTWWFWLLYVVVPLFAVYKLWDIVLWPALKSFLMSPSADPNAGQPDDARTKLRKQREQARAGGAAVQRGGRR
jgi:hypothetical protein